MIRKTWLFVLLAIFAFASFPSHAMAQGNFGKNSVQWRKLDWKYYPSPHFGIRHYFDLNDPKQYANMQKLVALLENNYAFYSSSQMFDFEIKERLPVIVFETHSDLEGSPLASPFLPEGVGAFVDWARIRMVAKADFEPQLFQRIVAHELAHQFQMKVFKGSVLGRILGLQNIPSGFIEGGAEYLTSLRLPHTRDDIRDGQMRMMGSDVHLMPSWEDLAGDRANGYVAWKMVYDFLDAKFGPGTGVKFHMQGIKGKGDLGLLLYSLSKGVLGNPSKNSELFNQEFFDYYNDLYELDRANRPKPYNETANFDGRNITPLNHPYPMTSPVLSPDGKRIACFTIQKNRVALVTFPIVEEVLYSEAIDPMLTRKNKNVNPDKDIRRPNGEKTIVNLTPQMIPIPYEYFVSQGFETWPRNGSDLDWSKDGRIAFFARKNRDHVLFVIDDKKGEILQEVVLDLDQGFSPKFSPDGKKIYFSAASHAIVDLYVVDLASGQVSNLTDDLRYDTAPAVSPDGTKIVYVGNDGDFNHLFMLNLSNGTKEQLTFGRYNDVAPGWSDSGKKLVFTSDQKDRIWSLYVLDLESNTRSLYLNFFGGVENPIFARNSDDKVYYTVYRNNDTFRGYVYPNHEIFEAKLKEPIKVEPVMDLKESNIYKFNSDDLFELELDPSLVKNPPKPPEDWMFEGGDFYLGGGTYYGVFASSYMGATNLMETKRHMFQFANYSTHFTVINYAYINTEKRLGRGINVAYNRYPVYYKFYDINERRPKGSYLINVARWQEESVTAFAQYPLSKWTRLEFMSGVRNIKFGLGDITPELFKEFENYFSDTDKQVFNIMHESNGPSLLTGIAIVRDTVVGTGNGPLHGNAFRAEAVLAPPVGNKLKGHMTTSAEARIYRHLTSGGGVVFAARAEAKFTTRTSGEIIVAGGSDRFRGREWGSVMGNELLYGSTELRFPLVDGVVFPGGMAIGPFRGLFFADAGLAKFKGEKYPTQKVKTYGAGIDFKPFQLIWTKQPNGKFVPSFYITFGW